MSWTSCPAALPLVSGLAVLSPVFSPVALLLSLCLGFLLLVIESLHWPLEGFCLCCRPPQKFPLHQLPERFHLLRSPDHLPDGFCLCQPSARPPEGFYLHCQPPERFHFCQPPAHPPESFCLCRPPTSLPEGFCLRLWPPTHLPRGFSLHRWPLSRPLERFHLHHQPLDRPL